jgi:hypothetical protein
LLQEDGPGRAADLIEQVLQPRMMQNKSGFASASSAVS